MNQLKKQINQQEHECVKKKFKKNLNVSMNKNKFPSFCKLSFIYERLCNQGTDNEFSF